MSNFQNIDRPQLSQGASAIKPLTNPLRPERGAQSELATPVESLTVQEFRRDVLDPNNPRTKPEMQGYTFVMLTADKQYCPPCPTVKEVYDDAARAAQRNGSAARFVSLDLTDAYRSQNEEQIQFGLDLAKAVRRQGGRDISAGLPAIVRVETTGTGEQKLTVVAHGEIQSDQMRKPDVVETGRQRIRQSLERSIGDTTR